MYSERCEYSLNKNKKQHKYFILVPKSIICDKSITHMQRSMLLSLWLHKKINKNKYTTSSIKGLSFRLSEGSFKLSRRMSDHLVVLQQKGYIEKIHDDQAILNQEGLDMIALPHTIKHLKTDIKALPVLLYLSLQKKYTINVLVNMSKSLGLDRHTIKKSINQLMDLGIIEQKPYCINGKRTDNFHLNQRYLSIFTVRDMYVKNPVSSIVQKSPLDVIIININNNNRIINRINSLITLKGMKMFVLGDIADSSSRYWARAICAKLLSKGKSVSENEVKDKINELYLSYKEKNVIKVFSNATHLINFICQHFPIKSYSLQELLGCEWLINDILNIVYVKTKRRFNANFIKYLATKLFKSDFRFYHINIFRELLVEKLLNEKRDDEEVSNWSDDKYIDWDAEHKKEKNRWNRK